MTCLFKHNKWWSLLDNNIFSFVNNACAYFPYLSSLWRLSTKSTHNCYCVYVFFSNICYICLCVSLLFKHMLLGVFTCLIVVSSLTMFLSCYIKQIAFIFQNEPFLVYVYVQTYVCFTIGNTDFNWNKSLIVAVRFFLKSIDCSSCCCWWWRCCCRCCFAL